MVEGKHIAVVIPAYNEEKLLETTLAGVPPFVDRIYVVDDASRDATVGRAHTAAAADSRITVIVHERNRGAGAAVVTGYRRALEDGAEVVCVMNGDNQMDPAEMLALVTPVVNDEVDYTKANRLFTGEAWNLIPHYRYLGNALLSLLTKIASGYWHVADSQAGYTAINRRMLELVDLDNVYPRYGYPNDMLVHLNVWSARVQRHPVASDLRRRRAVGDQAALGRAADLLAADEGLLLAHGPPVRDPRLPPARVLLHGRLLQLPASVLRSGSYTIARHFSGNPPTPGLATIVALMMTFSVLFTLFAMWFDMETNKDLR